MRANELQRTEFPYNNEDCETLKVKDGLLYEGEYTWRTCTKGCLQELGSDQTERM